jgi:hypothetical protein
MTKLLKYLIIIILISFINTGCTRVKFTLNSNTSNRKQIAVFMDGTNNRMRTKQKNKVKNSNVAKLFDLVKNENQAFYIEGVGTRFKFIGIESAAGISRRVYRSYQYICEKYQPGDTISMFGFSRGAMSCRILSNLIYTAGIVDMTTNKSNRSNRHLAKKIYKNYRQKDKSLVERRKLVADFIASKNLKLSAGDTVKIGFMGLWDTVDDIGWPSDWTEKDFDSPDPLHLYQICNVSKIYHAMALDDNRARLYTPMLLTSNKATCYCPEINIDNVVNEVWFSGAHSQVGGYSKSFPGLSNISLDWMISGLKPYNLIRDTTLPICNHIAVQNMQDSKVFRIITQHKNRSLDLYYLATLLEKQGKLKVHHTVIERIESGLAPKFKKQLDGFDWFEKLPYTKCFSKIGNQIKFDQSCDCIEVIKK